MLVPSVGKNQFRKDLMSSFLWTPSHSSCQSSKGYLFRCGCFKSETGSFSKLGVKSKDHFYGKNWSVFISALCTKSVLRGYKAQKVKKEGYLLDNTKYARTFLLYIFSLLQDTGSQHSFRFYCCCCCCCCCCLCVGEGGWGGVLHVYSP